MSAHAQRMTGAKAEPLSGWVVGFALFAGILMIIIGMFQALQGLAAIIEDDFFVVGSDYAFEVDVTTWGWIHLVGGTIVALAGFAVMRGQVWGRIVGVVLAALSATANFLYIPYYPAWSILLIALNVLVILALCSYNVAADESEA